MAGFWETFGNAAKGGFLPGSFAQVPEAQLLTQEQIDAQAAAGANPYYDLAQDTVNDYQNTYDSLTPYGDLLSSQYMQNQATRGQNLNSQIGAFNQVTQNNAGYLGNMSRDATAANQADQQLLQGYSSALQGANNMDASTVAELRGVASGMRQLDPTAYVGDYSSNPMDVARQQGVYDQLGGFASGAYNIDSQAALAEADPEALAAQKEVMAQLKERSDPRLTDAERALFMQARLQREQSDRANRDANYDELRRRGMSGSTMALSNLNASSQEAGNTRALADTTAAGKAVDRAEGALRDYGNMSNVIADQSFKRSFSTGSAADQTAQFNVGTQMQGTLGQGNMANTMRGQNDAIGMFNNDLQERHNIAADDFRASQQRDAWTRATGVADAGFKQSGNISDRATAYTNTATNSVNNQFNRNADVNRTGIQSGRDYMAGIDAIYGRDNENMRDSSNEASQAAQFGLGMGNLAVAGNNAARGYQAQGVASAAEDRRAAQAQNAAAEAQARQLKYEQDSKGLLDYIGL